VLWSVLLLGILLVIIKNNYNYAEKIAKHEAQTSVNKDLAYRSWVASHGGVYVPETKRTPPSPYLKNIKDRDFHAINKDFTLMNPAYTLSQMMKDYTKLYGIKTHITSKRLLNPKNKPDNWETYALDKIEEDRKQYYEISDIDGQKYFRLMNPLITKKSCLKCHAFQGYKIGDIRGGVSVSIPMKELYNDAFYNSMIIFFAFVIIWILGLISIRVFSTKISKYIDEKERLYEEYMYGLVNIIERRDAYTAGHSARVAKYAQMVAKEMNFSKYEIHLLHRAGMLHDLGKVAIPDSVFLKPTKLTESEYKLIQEHVNISYEMLDGISVFSEIKEIVRDHHEHYDGKGYPRGLKGHETPMLAQVLSLADAFDAMTTDRVYKGRKSVQEALEEISRLSAKQFNPLVVKAALKALSTLVIDSNHHQIPQTLLERERFSYFYKDLLTNFKNEIFLKVNIANINNFQKLLWVSLNHFHSYNKRYGWSQGDEVLVSVSSLIENYFSKDSEKYRFYGDNFFILTNEDIDIDGLKVKLDEVLTPKDIAFSIKLVDVESLSVDKSDRLEDVIAKIH
jgi:putative nucleotidyltransferase with HDIG domain